MRRKKSKRTLSGRKCKPGYIWDNEKKVCRKPTKDEDFEMRSWKQAKGAASLLGTGYGIMASTPVALATGISPSKAAIVGGLIGRKKAIKYQKEMSNPPYDNVPSRRIPKEYRNSLFNRLKKKKKKKK
mgnify:CR=1 FL=1|jgi:hypothetical protein|tara:strand:+ start:633 stop:1016 length:384 start_codon:yes stop_codon:yes gene_type:complete